MPGQPEWDNTDYLRDCQWLGINRRQTMPPNKKCVVHQYKKIEQKPSGRIIYRCMNCAHYITPEFLLGRQSICWDCKSIFAIDGYASERKYPKCENCRNKVTPLSKKFKEESPGPSIPVKEEPQESDNIVADILKRYGI